MMKSIKIKRALSVLLIVIFLAIVALICWGYLTTDSGLKQDKDNVVQTNGFISSKDNNYIYRYGRFKEEYNSDKKS